MRRSNLAFPAKTRLLLKISVPVLSIVWLLAVYKPSAHAVPSYSRQTGLACSTCHYAPPELTPFGRKFKLEGYTFATKSEVSEDKKDHNTGLHLLEEFPLSLLFFTSYSSTKAPVPATQNGNFEFPQQASLFLAGSWGEHIGSFAQVTYTSTGNHFGWDNTDIRYANTSHQLFGKPLTFGLTFNNNPTVEDLWNSTPAWGYPFSTSNAAPVPTAGAVINNRLGQDVAGVGGYAMWDDHFYVASAVYRSDHLGGAQPIPDAPNNTFPFNVSGTAPYWRVAWQTSTTNNNIEVGSYGMHLKSYPNAVTGPRNSYTDWAVDFQYDRIIPQWKSDVLSFRGTYIRENSSLLATLGSGSPGIHLNTVQGNVEYHFGNRVTATGAFFNITGTANSTLYAPIPVFGSRTGSPSSTGYIAEINWWPQQNIKLGAQYTGYTRFNGAGTNYDGFKRDASANNSTYVILEFTF
jgi:hypothetical protein